MLKSSLLSLFKMPLLRELTVYVYPSTFSRFADKIIQLFIYFIKKYGACNLQITFCEYFLLKKNVF